MNSDLKNEIIFDMQKKMLDIFSLYSSNGLRMTLHAGKGIKNPEAVKVEITEFK